jgi:hypothetical protein
MRRVVFLTLAMTLAILLGLARRAYGDCETPIAQAARDALRADNFWLVAVWVEPVDEPVLHAAFQRARVTRAVWPPADAVFVETAGRLHRARAAITCEREALVEQAVASGGDDAIVEAMVTEFRSALRARLHDVATRRMHRRGDIEAARAAVTTYVELVRYVTRVGAAIATPPPRLAEPIRHEP